MWTKDPDLVFYQMQIRIWVTQKVWIWPDPDPQHWLTLKDLLYHQSTWVARFFKDFLFKINSWSIVVQETRLYSCQPGLSQGKFVKSATQWKPMLGISLILLSQTVSFLRETIISKLSALWECSLSYGHQKLQHQCRPFKIWFLNWCQFFGLKLTKKIRRFLLILSVHKLYFYF